MLRGEALLEPFREERHSLGRSIICKSHPMGRASARSIFFYENWFWVWPAGGTAHGLCLSFCCANGNCGMGCISHSTSFSFRAFRFAKHWRQRKEKSSPSDNHPRREPKLSNCGGALLQAALSGALGRRRKASAAPIRSTPVLAANDPNGSFVGPSDFTLDRERPVSLFQGKEKWGVHPSSPVWGQNRS